MQALSADRLRLLLNRLRERLWAKPLAMCVLSAWSAFSAKLADDTGLKDIVPKIDPASLESLLKVQASSMMVIATFAVASMVSAFASASNSATPRAFKLVVADDVSQNALSTFIGAFIFSIVALTATQNGFYGHSGLFMLFALTLMVFAIVILTFVRWVDQIARLGRMATTIRVVEKAASAALQRRKYAAHLQGVPVQPPGSVGRPVYGATVGYVQYVDVAALHAWAKEVQGKVVVAALPGTFAAPGVALAHVYVPPGTQNDFDTERVAKAFMVDDERQFADDPRFGLVVLSEIAGRALSSSVNDPGSAIGIIGTLVRLFAQWAEPLNNDDVKECKYDRVEVPMLNVQDMFDDAFTAIARDGAASIEVAVRLQMAFAALRMAGDPRVADAATRHARLALDRALLALELPHDVATLRSAAGDATA